MTADTYLNIKHTGGKTCREYEIDDVCHVCGWDGFKLSARIWPDAHLVSICGPGLNSFRETV